MNLQLERCAGLLLLIIATLFVGWGAHFELYYADIQFSDVAFHLSVLDALDQAIKGGQNPLDFWYDRVPYGFALFRSYQYLPYLIVYGVYWIGGGLYPLGQLLVASIFVLVTLFPVACFFGLRVAGLPVLEAGIAAVLSVLVADGSEYGIGLQNYTFGTVGLYTQLWAMVFLVPALGASYRYLRQGSGLGLALLFIFFTFGSHVIAAAILILSIACMVLIGFCRERKFRREPLILLGLGLLVTAHQWVFILLDSPYINRSALEPAWKYDGRGVDYVLNLLWSGGLFDCNRLPVLTLSLLVALSYHLIDGRKIVRAEAALFQTCVPVLFFLFLSLCMGRAIWGGLFAVFPFLGSLHVHRFAIAVHIFGVIIIATALAPLMRTFLISAPRSVLSVFLLIVCLSPAFSERSHMYRENAERHEVSAELADADSDLEQLSDAIVRLPYGWTYIGSSSSWQEQLKIAGYIPLDLFTTMHGVPTVGGILFHAFSLAGETLFDFNPYRPQHFNLFGIRNIVAPTSWQAPSEFSLSADAGRFVLWTRESTMLFVADDRFRASGELKGRTGEVREFVQTYAERTERAGVLSNQQQQHPWKFTATADMNQKGLLVGAVGFHPNWKVTVDGVSAETSWVLPGFVAAEIPTGVHDVSFEYQGSELKKYLLAIAAIALLVSLSCSHFRNLPQE